MSVKVNKVKKKSSKKVEAKKAEAVTTVTNKKQGTSSEQVESPFDEIVSEEPLANVGYTMAYTRNLGNYESVKAQVSLHIPCKEEDIDETFGIARKWVHDKMDEVQAEYDESLDDE